MKNIFDAENLSITAENDNQLYASDPQISPDLGRNFYGFSAHYHILEEHKEMADRYDIYIEYQGNNQFRIASRHGKNALEKLITPFSKQIDDKGFASLDQKTLKDFLTFLHQPIAFTLGEEKRRTGHHMTRLLTLGRVEIKPWVNKTLEDATSLSCHLKGQRSMEERGIWKKPELWKAPEQPGIWRGKDEEWGPEDEIRIVSSVPGTSYDPNRGFVFDVADILRTSENTPNLNQRALIKYLWNSINAATKNRYADLNATQISMSADELTIFYKNLIHIAGIEEKIARTEIEEKAERSFKAILEQSQELAINPRFQNAIAEKRGNTDSTTILDNIKLLASSYLTPIMQQDVTSEAWRHNFITESKLKLSNPIARTTQQAAVLALTIQKLKNSGHTGHEIGEAIARQYYRLLGFTADLTESMKEGSQHKRAQKAISEKQKTKFAHDMDAVSNAVDATSVSGIKIAEIEDDLSEILDSVGNIFGQNGNIVKQQAVGYYRTMLGFWEGVWESTSDSPTAAAIVASVLGYTWFRYGFDPETSAPILEQYESDWGTNSNATTDTFTLESDLIAQLKEASDAAKKLIPGYDPCTNIYDLSCHIDGLPKIITDPIESITGYNISYIGLRHYLGNTLIAGTAMQIQEAQPAAIAAAAQSIESFGQSLGYSFEFTINPDTQYLKTSEANTKIQGLLSIDMNMLQDASHTSMGIFGYNNGATFGFAGLAGMAGLSAEFINPTYRLASNTKQLITRNVAYTVQQAAFYGVSAIHHDTAQFIHARAGQIVDNATPRYHERLVTDIAKNVKGIGDSLTLDKTENLVQKKDMPEFKAKAVPTGWYGITEEDVTISPENLALFKSALNRFALTLEYSANDIGIDSETYTQELLERIKTVENALNNYIDSQDKSNSLQLKYAFRNNIEQIAGAEFKWTGSKEIYDCIFPEPDESEYNKKGFKEGLNRFVTESPTLKNDKRLHTFKRSAYRREGRIQWSEYRQKQAEMAKSATIPVTAPRSLKSLKDVWHTAQYGYEAAKTGTKKLKHRTLQGAGLALDASIIAARLSLQETFNQIPHKKKAVTAFAAVCTAGLVLDTLSVTHPAVQAASATGSFVTSTGTIWTIFGGLNLPQDFALHSVLWSGLALVGIGAGYYGGKRLYRPTKAALAEATYRGKEKIKDALLPKPDAPSL